MSTVQFNVQQIHATLYVVGGDLWSSNCIRQQTFEILIYFTLWSRVLLYFLTVHLSTMPLDSSGTGWLN